MNSEPSCFVGLKTFHHLKPEKENENDCIEKDSYLCIICVENIGLAAIVEFTYDCKLTEVEQPDFCSCSFLRLFVLGLYL